MTQLKAQLRDATSANKILERRELRSRRAFEMFVGGWFGSSSVGEGLEKGWCWVIEGDDETGSPKMCNLRGM
jgi:hypothetical protein